MIINTSCLGNDNRGRALFDTRIVIVFLDWEKREQITGEFMMEIQENMNWMIICH